MPPPEAFRAIRLEDYTPPAFRVDRVELRIELDRELTRVTTTLAIRGNHGGRIELNGEGLQLHAISIDGNPVPDSGWTLHDGLLRIETRAPVFTLRLNSATSPAANPREMGLFERRGILATECEPHGFRMLGFFPDRPDILTTYRVTLVGDPELYPVMLCNGNVLERGTLEDGRHWVTWDDPIPKPSYIFALFAGPFGRLTDSYTTGSGRHIELNIYIEKQLLERCAHAMASLKRALAWDEKTYGFEYDLDIYNIVGLVGHGNAMENKGLNLFAAEGIVADKDTTSDEDFLVIERIIAHEVFHNWTGNRVTCRDWFQLCLKEGLTRFRDQSYDQSLSMGSIKRIWQVKALRRNQFPNDDGSSAHPVRPRSYIDVENFYNATVYDKGAEIVRMLHGMLGEQRFHAGIDLFIERHDLQAVTLEDFLAAMADASGRDLRQFARWYEISGRPRLRVTQRYDAAKRCCELGFTQHGHAVADGPMVIPVAMGLLDAQGNALAFRVESAAATTSEAVLEITALAQTVRLHEVASAPVVSLLRDFSAPISLDSAADEHALALLALADSDPYVRWDSMQRLQIGAIRTLAALPESGRGQANYDGVIALCRRLLESADREKGLTAELLDIPDEPNLGEGLAEIDLDALMDGRARLTLAIAQALQPELLETYHRNHATAPWSLGEESIGARMLKNACLRLLASLKTQAVIDLCHRQLLDADCMTDRFAALTLLVDIECPERDAAIEWTCERWKHDPMLIGYWFKAQALGRTPDVIPRLQALQQHPVYDPGNTAHAMALLGTFFRQNRVAFHDPSGAAYEWLADALLFVDTVRPAASRWLMPQIAQWRRYDPKRRNAMQVALRRVSATAGISGALRENVSAALGDSDDKASQR